ncbi:MAG: hypothetical protein ACXABK_04435 [Candidatus Heimdallarchaeaceae archaeon]
MEKSNALNSLFISIREELFELMNMIEIKIDVGYILEEMEELSHNIQKMSETGIKIGEEMKDIYNSLYKKYKNKLAAFLNPRESNYLIGKIKGWIQELPNLM